MLTVPRYKQSPAHCGPTALRAVLAFYGAHKTEKELAMLAHTSFEYGTSAEDIANTAQKLGFRAQIKDNSTIAELERLVKEGLPVIVAWFSTYEGHYSVVVKVTDTQIFLMDPEFGKIRHFPTEKFLGIWFDFRGPYLTKGGDIVLRRMIVVEPKKNYKG